MYRAHSRAGRDENTAKTTRTAREKREVKAVMEFFKLEGAGRPKDARPLFSSDCVHHNPYLSDGIEALLESIAAVQGPEAASSGMTQDMRLETKHVLVEGNLVAVHTTVQSASDRSKGFRQIHLFLFDDEKIAEYWDVTQTAPEGSPNAYRMF